MVSGILMADRAWHDTVPGEGSEPSHLEDPLAVVAVTRAAVQQGSLGKGDPRLLAQLRLALEAVEALAALCEPREHHAVTGRQVRHALADLRHGASPLVPQHYGHRAREPLGEHRDVGVADPGGADLDLHLPGARRLQVHLDDPERLVRALENSGLGHGNSRRLSCVILDS